jgi:hypothetical protein
VGRVVAREEEDRAVAQRGGELVHRFFSDGIRLGGRQQGEQVGLQR